MYIISHSKIVDVESLVTTVKSNIHYFSWWLTTMKSNIHSHIVDMIYYMGMDITFHRGLTTMKSIGYYFSLWSLWFNIYYFWNVIPT